MSITFGYFQYDPDLFFLLLFPMIIQAIVAILLNVLLLRSGKAEEEMKKRIILIRLSIINIAFILLLFVIPSVMGTSVTSVETDIITFYWLFTNLLETVPFFITYGIMMYWYGKVNRDVLTKKFSVSTKILLLCNCYLVIGSILRFIPVIPPFQYGFYYIQGLLRPIFLILYFVGWVFFALHGKMAGNKNFMYTGIAGCVLVTLMYWSNLSVFSNYLFPFHF